jgi:hypothetical protein
MQITKEYEHIVEYCYIPKQKKFVVRFLDGSSYVLSIEDLPKKLQTRSPDWENATLSEDNSALIIEANLELREIPAHIIHARGKEA